MATLRERASHRACTEVATSIDPAVFQAKFGAPVADLELLMAAKSVTLPRLVALMPPGMQDPTPFLYNESLYTSASLLVVGSVANHMIRRVDRNRFDLLPDGNVEDYSFESADVDKDGVIDREEARRFGLTDQQIEDMDTDTDGVIERDEWQAAHQRKESQRVS